MQVAPDCQEKLPNGSVSQLEARLQRLPVHVRHAVGKDAPVNERRLVFSAEERRNVTPSNFLMALFDFKELDT